MYMFPVAGSVLGGMLQLRTGPVDRTLRHDDIRNKRYQPPLSSCVRTVTVVQKRAVLCRSLWKSMHDEWATSFLRCHQSALHQVHHHQSQPSMINHRRAVMQAGGERASNYADMQICINRGSVRWDDLQSPLQGWLKIAGGIRMPEWQRQALPGQAQRRKAASRKGRCFTTSAAGLLCFPLDPGEIMPRFCIKWSYATAPWPWQALAARRPS